MDLQDRVSGMLEDVHRSSGGVSDPRGPSGGGSRLRHVPVRDVKAVGLHCRSLPC